MYKKNIEVIGRRGTIYDNNGNELVGSITSYSLYLEPKKIKDVGLLLDKLEKYIEFDREKKEKIIKRFRKNSFLWFKRGIEKKIYREIKEEKIEGINFKREYKRIYTEGKLASNIIGMVGIDEKDFLDNKGLEGIENYFNSDLRGRKTMLEIMTDNRGYNVFSENTETEFEKYNGADIYMTIDKVIQYWAEKELLKTIENNKAKKGFIIVMDTKDFNIYAVANYPTFSPDDFENTSRFNFKNYAFLDVYEPGSTFKLPIIAAALTSEKFNMDSEFDCPGYIKIDSGPEISCERAHGHIDLKDAIAYSCNVAMAQMAMEMEYSHIYDVITSLGFGQKTGVEFPGEEDGLLNSPSRMSSKRDVASMGFGYHIAVTGIQMARAYAALVNGGIIKTPRLIDRIEKDGEIIKEFAKDTGERVISEEQSEKIRKILASVVEYGTGQSVGMEKFSVGGKTGTAKKAHPHGYYKDKYIASFIGVFPVEKPEILIYTVIDEPSEGNYYGGSVAGPAFKKLASNIVDYLKMSPDIIKKEEKNTDKMIVPNFTGITKSLFYNRANMLNMKFKTFGSGDHVVFQEPGSGKIMNKGDIVEIYFGNLKTSEKSHIVPDLRGFTMRKALRELNKRDLKYEISGNGFVKDQSPAPGTEIDENTVIRLEFAF